MNALRFAMFLMGIGLTAASPFSAAHNDEYFDSIQAPHGGQMRMAGPYHLELVVKDKEIVVYVTDHAETAISTAGGSGKVNVLNDHSKHKVAVRLAESGENTLKGTGDFSVTPETVVSVFIELPGQEVQSASFTPLKPKSAAGTAPRGGGHDHSDHSHHH
ncbi:hypothetical protein [Nitrosovibrio sp. Nv17]|jgi:hypothetical protein|uniref:hypothetical protein n=1 Tax=Nitrosovibrio sp. Nv17 TaxID=1855339 RepID=UPI000908A0F2|nr:hypothetical protein [Nitrosovibrio sp. Nv17]SFW13116.1 hypothetical protein SAMN05216414_10218 [Nitrosovibrio sp. Nv17]